MPWLRSGRGKRVRCEQSWLKGNDISEVLGCQWTQSPKSLLKLGPFEPGQLQVTQESPGFERFSLDNSGDLTEMRVWLL